MAETTDSVDAPRAGSAESVASIFPFLLARGIATELGYPHSKIALIELFPWGITVHTKDGKSTHYPHKLYG